MTIDFSLRSVSVVAIMAAAMVAASAAPSAASTGAMRAYYERSFVLAAHQRCGLFAPVVVSALTASTYQARGAALRAGVSDAEVTAQAQRARGQGGRVACSDPELQAVKARVEAGFSGWNRTTRMTFPGDRSEWRANRMAFSSPGWRLAQTSSVGASPVMAGLSAGGDTGLQLSAVVAFHGRPRPYAARIVMRDPTRMERAWLVPVAQSSIGMGAARVADVPPASARRDFLASASSVAPDGLLPQGARSGEIWRFPSQAADMLAQLDPRETFLIEFVFRDDSVATVRFEVGDFAAGRAFVSQGG